MPLKRVIAYVDGFNLYYGMKGIYGDRYNWLDLVKLCEGLCRPEEQRLLGVKYFTARIPGGRKDHPRWLREKLAEKQSRQSVYLEALKAHCGKRLIVHEGVYRTELVECMSCHHVIDEHEEKMTDVKIATELLLDAIEDEFDTAILISGDSDLVPPLVAIRDIRPEKRIICVFPPNRVSKELKKCSDANFMIYEKPFKNGQLPNPVIKDGQHELHRPDKWR